MKNIKVCLAACFIAAVLLSCFQGIFANDVQMPFSQSNVASSDSGLNDVDAQNNEPKWWPTLEDEQKYGRYKPRYIKEESGIAAGDDERALATPYAIEENIYFKFWESDDTYKCTHRFLTATPNGLTKLENQHPSMIKTYEYGKVFCTEGGYGLFLNNGANPVPSNSQSAWDSSSGWNTARWSVSKQTYSDSIENKVYRICCDYYGRLNVENGRYQSTFTQMAMWNMMPASAQHSEGMSANSYLSYFTGSSVAINEYSNFLQKVVIPQLRVWQYPPSFSETIVNIAAGETKVLPDTNESLQYFDSFSYTSGGITISHKKGENVMTVKADLTASPYVSMSESSLKAAGICKYPDVYDGEYITLTSTKRQNLLHCNGKVTPIGMRIDFKVNVPEGFAKVRKSVQSNEHLVSMAPEQYNLAGAEYTVYTDYECTQKAGTLVTNSQQKGPDGKLYAQSNALKLRTGTYYVKETKAPKGYMKDPPSKKYELRIENGQTVILQVNDKPLFDPMDFVMKKSVENADTSVQKYLEGAEYTVKYYAPFYRTESELVGKTPLRTWVFKTDSSGIIKIANAWKIGGDGLFVNDAGSVVGLYGTYTFEETKAPPGFKRNTGKIIKCIDNNRRIGNMTAHNTPILSEIPDPDVKHRILVNKIIPAGHIFKPFGIPRIVFELSGRDIYGNIFKLRNSLYMDPKTTYQPVEKQYKATVVFDNLPPGTYTLREILPSRYKISKIDGVSANGTVTGNEVEFELIKTEEGRASYANVISKWNDISQMTSVVNHFRASVQ